MTNNQLDRSQDSHTYYYDSVQRFTKMERSTIGGTPSFYQGYTLDALANWSSFNNNGTTESRSHDVMNAITFRGATSLSHDLNGNLTNDGNQKYIWDELNRLVEVRDSGNNIICDYYYNANNLRVEKHHTGGAKEQYYYDGTRVLVETDGSQAKMREYINGGQYIDEVILVVNGSTYNYYMSDLRYCVTGFIDSTGAVVERARYDGYGKRTLLDASYATITTANVDQSYGYTGIRHDNESGLQYYRARYFDNYLGRFINHDPLGYVDGMNLYRGYFVVNSMDPTGKEDIWTTFTNNVSQAYNNLVNNVNNIPNNVSNTVNTGLTNLANTPSTVSNTVNTGLTNLANAPSTVVNNWNNTPLSDSSIGGMISGIANGLSVMSAWALGAGEMYDTFFDTWDDIDGSAQFEKISMHHVEKNKMRKCKDWVNTTDFSIRNDYPNIVNNYSQWNLLGVYHGTMIGKAENTTFPDQGYVVVNYELWDAHSLESLLGISSNNNNWLTGFDWFPMQKWQRHYYITKTYKCCK